MEFVTPKVILLAETQVSPGGVKRLLDELGTAEWSTDAQSGSEKLVEIAGRLCYKAFGTSLNANLTKVREGNHAYIGNILKQHHGSVLEHGTVTFALLDVSRILTHELVRHRAGTGFSQESGRFVRVDKIKMYKPKALSVNYLHDHVAHIAAPADEHDHESWAIRLQDAIEMVLIDLAEYSEKSLRSIANQLGLNDEKMPFSVKKALTSAIRRWSLGGATNDIVITANHRAWRHMIEMRTSPGAEEEIILVFNQIGHFLKAKFPAIYQDMEFQSIPDHEGWVFEHSKV